MAHIILDRVGVEFPIHNAHSRSLQLRMFGVLGGKLGAHQHAVFVQALKDVSFTLEDGDRIGIVGHNGAGKTTLLRLLAGVYEPTAGRVQIEGRVSSFTDITLGMDPEATGWANITLRCIFLGMTFKEARAAAPAIAEFSELREFLELPVRTYSLGMFVRLAFAISTSIEPEIIVMDEMIGAGDARFMSRAQERIAYLLQKTRILVLASHQPEIFKSFCNRLIWLEHGEVRRIGDVHEVYDEYLASVAAAAE
ncbi:MAG: ABC transporter ATP-binding protein [Caulobacteraceae bacterium]